MEPFLLPLPCSTMTHFWNLLYSMHWTGQTCGTMSVAQVVSGTWCTVMLTHLASHRQIVLVVSCVILAMLALYD